MLGKKKKMKSDTALLISTLSQATDQRKLITLLERDNFQSQAGLTIKLAPTM